MSTLLTLAYLFFIGSLLGWWMELFYRRFNNPDKKWVNPGFCTGPYLPIYGCGLCILYLIASLEPLNPTGSVFWNKTLLFAAMAVCMTVIEYIGGYFTLKYFHVRLWDYREEWGNIQGIICPKFSFAWAVLGALYYLLIHPHILTALNWLAHNLAFSFFIGFFFGIFTLDVCHALQLMNRLKRFADDNQLVLILETIKTDIRAYHDQHKLQYHFFRPFRSDIPLNEHLKNMAESWEHRKRVK